MHAITQSLRASQYLARIFARFLGYAWLVVYCRAGICQEARDRSPAKDKVSIEIVIRGDLAARNLGQVYYYLKDKFPALIESLDPSDVVPAESKIGWEVAVSLGKWPAGAFQDEAFEKAFLQRRGSPPVFKLPAATVTTGHSVGVLPLPEGYKSQLTAEQRASLCKAQGWLSVVAADTDVVGSSQIKDCIVRVIPEKRLPGLPPVAAQIVVRRPIYFLKLQNQVPAAGIKNLEKKLIEFLKQADSKGRVDPLANRSIEVRGLPDNESIRLENASSVSSRCGENSNFRFSLIMQKKPIAVSLGDVPESAVILDKNVPNRLELPTTNPRFSYLNHPFLVGTGEDENSEVKVSCDDIVAPGPLAQGSAAHALWVASPAFGKKVSIRIDEGKELQASGLINASGIQFNHTSFLSDGLIGNFLTGLPHAIIASLSGTIMMTNDDEAVRKARRAFELSSAKGSIFIAAPSRGSAQNGDTRCGLPNVDVKASLGSAAAITESFGMFLPADEFTEIPFSECKQWPACLGTTPFAMVVAALSDEGNLWCEHDYLLGSRVVAIAAPGENVLTAEPMDSDKPKFSVRSGSSFANAVAAAVAGILQSRGITEAADIYARLAATADLEFAPDKIRYGRLNIDRALIGTEQSVLPSKESSDVIWMRDLGTDTFTQHDYAVVEAPQETTFVCRTDINDLPKGLRQKRFRDIDRTTKGYLRLFIPGTSYDGPTSPAPRCIELARVLRIVKSKKDHNGIPLFNVVFLTLKKIRAGELLFPMILRDIAFQSTVHGEGHLGCAWDGSPQSGKGKLSCLVAKVRGSGDAQPVNLRVSDIVFSPRSISRPRQIVGVK